MIPPETIEIQTIDDMVAIRAGDKVVTEVHSTIVYVKPIDTFYWLNDETKKYEKLERF